MKSLVLIFRGTMMTSLPNWIGNAKGVLVNCPLGGNCGKIHTGFASVFEEFSQDLTKAAKEYVDKGYNRASELKFLCSAPFE